MSNHFDLLAEDEDTFSIEDGESSDIDFFKFESLVPEVKVVLNDANFSDSKFKASVSLLTCSSKYGYMVVGTVGGFIIGKTVDIRTQILAAKEGSEVVFKDYIEVSVDQGSVNIVALTSDQLQLLVGVSGGMLLVYNVHDIIVKEKMEPILSHRFAKEIEDIVPNPQAHPDLAAICLANQDCHFFNIRDKEILSTITSITSVSWSFRGKQIACGFSSGRISTFGIDGKPTDRIDIPDEMKANKAQETVNRYVSGLIWVDNNTFFAIYSRPCSNEEPNHTPFIIDRKTKPQTSYLQLEQVSEFTNSDHRANSHFYLQLVRKLGSNIPFLITIANANATTLNLVGKEAEGKWATWLIENGGIPKLPTSSSFEDTFPVGLAVDYSSLEPFTPEDSSGKVSPMPILFFLTNEGNLCAYHYYNVKMAEEGEKFENNVTAIDINLIPEADMTKVTFKQEALPDKESKPSNKEVKKSNPESDNAGFSKVPVMKTTTKMDENNKGEVSTFPSSSTPSAIPRPKHASIGWGSLANASNTSSSLSVSAKSNVTPLNNINTSGTKKSSTANKPKASPSQAFGQPSNVDLSSKIPFGNTSFNQQPTPKPVEDKQALKTSDSSSTEHSDSHTSSGSEDFVKIPTDVPNNSTDNITKSQSNIDRNTDQNEVQDVNQTQPAPNQQNYKKENASQQNGEKHEFPKESVITEQNVDTPLATEAKQVTEEKPEATSSGNDSKGQVLEQKEKDLKEKSAESERSDKEEPSNVSDQKNKKDPVLDESKTNVEKEELTPKDKDVSKVTKTAAKESESETQDPVPKEEQVQDQEPVSKDDYERTETEPSEKKQVLVEDKKEAPIESRGAADHELEPKSKESAKQQVPKENEEMDKPNDKAGSQDDLEDEEFEKIEKPDTPEPVVEETIQAPNVNSNSGDNKSESVPTFDKQIDTPSDTTSTFGQAVEATSKDMDTQASSRGINEAEEKKTESIVPQMSTESTTNTSNILIEGDVVTLVKDNANPELPVDHQKSDQIKNGNISDKTTTSLPKKLTDEQNVDEKEPNVIEPVDEITDNNTSNVLNDETTCTADELSTNEEGTEECVEEEEEEEEVTEVEPPEIFFSTYQRKFFQPTQNYQNTGIHPLAISMENQYFDTLHVMEELKFERHELHYEISFLRKSNTKDISTFEDKSTWRMGNIYDLSTILKDVKNQLTEAEQYESQSAHLNEKSTLDDKVIDIFKKLTHAIREFEAANKTDKSDKNKDDASKMVDTPNKNKQDSAKSKKLPDRKKLIAELVALCQELVDESHKIQTLDDSLFEDVQAKLDAQSPNVAKTSSRNHSLFPMKHTLRKIRLKLNNYLSELDNYEAKERLICSKRPPNSNKGTSENAFVVKSIQTDRCLNNLFSFSNNHSPRSVKKTGFI